MIYLFVYYNNLFIQIKNLKNQYFQINVIKESSALISQICKNDEGSSNYLMNSGEFYSELTAQINCFKDASPKNGNSRNFRFEILSNALKIQLAFSIDLN